MSEFDRIQMQKLPVQSDMYLKNGKMLPNSSKNRNRQQSTTTKIKFGIVNPL